jgi:hypothetical protein
MNPSPNKTEVSSVLCNLTLQNAGEAPIPEFLRNMTEVERQKFVKRFNEYEPTPELLRSAGDVQRQAHQYSDDETLIPADYDEYHKAKEQAYCDVINRMAADHQKVLYQVEIRDKAISGLIARHSEECKQFEAEAEDLRAYVRRRTIGMAIFCAAAVAIGVGGLLK